MQYLTFYKKSMSTGLSSKYQIKEEQMFSTMLKHQLQLNDLEFDIDLSGTKLVLVFGVSTSGKDSLVNELLLKQKGLIRIPRATSRAPRPGELDGVDYFFNLNDSLFWSEYGGNTYAFTESALSMLKDVKTGVMIQGLVYLNPIREIVESLGGEVIPIYILPSSIASGAEEALRIVESRLPIRHQEVIKYRLESIRRELGFVYENISTLREMGINLIENTPVRKGVNPQALKAIEELL